MARTRSKSRRTPRAKATHAVVSRAVIDEATRDSAPVSDPVGDFLAKQRDRVKETSIEFEAIVKTATGEETLIGKNLRQAAAEGELTADDAQYLQKILKANRRPADPGRKKEPATLELIELIARMRMQVPPASLYRILHAIAKLLDKDYESLRDFEKNNRHLIKLAMARLSPNPPCFVLHT
jgi:hypothetical protein